MSAPAANAFSEPVITMQPIASSASKASTAAASSRISALLSALSACGRLSRIRPTRPRVSTMMCSLLMARFLGVGHSCNGRPSRYSRFGPHWQSLRARENAVKQKQGAACTGVVAGLVSATVIGVLAMAPSAQAVDDPPYTLAREGFFYLGGADASLSDRDGAWRHAVGHDLYRHARRPRRLGAIFRAPRLRGLCGRPTGPRPLRLRQCAVRPEQGRRYGGRPAALSVAGKIQTVAAGAPAHAMAGQRRAGRSGQPADGVGLCAGDRR